MATKRKSEDNIEDIYQKKTQLEHILLRPDTYIGSIELFQQYLWVYDKGEDQIVYKQIQYVPGLYKIFDEILVNAADNYQKDKNMDMVKVEIDPAANKISVWNNGKGIPVQIHKVHNIYVPDMIFGQLLTSSNYNDDQKKVTGGRNGFGAKLANIFSTKFIVETADAKNKLFYKQVFKNNMGVREEPEITPNKNGDDYTKITFYPDLAKFKMSHLDDDIVSLMTKRVYDMAGTTPSGVQVKLNGKKIDIKNFPSYVDLYLKTEETKQLPKLIEKTTSERWEVIASLSDGQFQQVSFVNSICTIKGGSHVNYIADQIVDKIGEVLKKKQKGLLIKPHQIKSNLWLFVNALIENPAFDSQTKETLTTKPANFGSTCTLSEKFLKDILNSGIIESIVTVAKAKEEAKLAKTLGPGKKKSKLLGIPKLEDANDAGTKNAENCTIILTEGDSAKSLALAGIEVVGRDKYGVFPLRGKFLNVREASNAQMMANPEIQNLIKILGVQVGKKYEDLKSLRYGSIMIMTDQDHDGSHIKGLIINFIHHFWPSLLKYNGFLKEFVTPIIKASKGNESHSFFTIREYEIWAEGKNLKSWKVKYYKGLGTSTSKEAKEYFSDVPTHQVDFEYVDQEDEDCIDLAFNKKLADKRKEWLTTYSLDQYVDHSQAHLRYKDFINKELIQFSLADCARSIPCLCDGLKPGQRKILFACFKRKLKGEIKVAQLSGYVAEHSAYHHGEVSLQQTIITMAQNFVGSNNINTLLPIGQFGTRNQGGKEAASARYIFTSLSPVTRTLFHEDDDALLNYLEEEGQSIEPDYYLPILPLSLVNGAEGIGTGWSTSIPCYNPRDLVMNLKRMMRNEPLKELHPWYKGYTGAIELKAGGKNYTVTGVYNILSQDELEITELPIGKWTRDYKNFLEELSAKDEIDEIREYHQENRVHFVLRVPKLQQIVEGEGVLSKFKLQSSIATTNYVLFDYQNKIRRYNGEEEIMKEFYGLRVTLYQRRKDFMLARLRKEFETISNKVKFIMGVINDEIKVNKVKRQVLLKRLKEFGLLTWSQLNEILPEKKKITVVVPDDNKDDGEEQKVEVEEVVAAGEIPLKEYEYLVSMPIYSLTEEKVIELKKQQDEKKAQYDRLAAMTIPEIWDNDLESFLVQLDKYEENEEKDRKANGGMKNDGKKKRAPKKTNANAPSQVTKKPQGQGGDKKATVKPKENQQKASNRTDQSPQVMKAVPKEKPREEMTLMERIQLKKKQEGGGSSQTLLTAHIPKASALKEMSATDREAFQNGTRKRKASISNSPPKNLQRKQISSQPQEDDDEVIKPRRGAQRKMIVESEEEESESDFEFNDDDDSI